MDAINAAVAELETTQGLVLAKIAELKAAGDPVALQAAADKITAVNQALKDAIA